MVYSFAKASRIFLDSDSGFKILCNSSLVKADYLMALAVLAVSRRECTKMMICWEETLYITFS